MTGLGIAILVRTQPATSTSATSAAPVRTIDLQQGYEASWGVLPDSGNFLKSSSAQDAASRWKLHLILALIKHPQMNETQVRVILDALSLSSVKSSKETRLSEINAGDIEALKRRALVAFPKSETADLFANLREKADDILDLYYYVSSLPLKERKATFRVASSKDKSDLWRTHLALFLIKCPELNDRQKEIILAAMSLTTPEHFEVQATNPAWKVKVREPLRRLEEQILGAFSFRDAVRIFATLGDEAEAAWHAPTESRSVFLNTINFEQVSDLGTTKDQMRGRTAGQDMFRGGGPCECSTDSDWCPLSGYCNGTNCTPTSSGCGTIWSYPCNGASCR